MLLSRRLLMLLRRLLMLLSINDKDVVVDLWLLLIRLLLRLLL